MNPQTLSSPRSNWIHALIQEVTNAPAKDLASIEQIMRDEVFHSTLDWQTREQLAVGAQHALARLRENQEWYDLDHACRVAMFHKLQAESALREDDTPSNRSAVADAEFRYRTLRDKLLVRLDESTPN